MSNKIKATVKREFEFNGKTYKTGDYELSQECFNLAHKAGYAVARSDKRKTKK